MAGPARAPAAPAAPPRPPYDHCRDAPFTWVVRFMEACAQARSKDKTRLFRDFLDRVVPRPSDDIFQIFRLLMPAEDSERGNYLLKEDKLAKVLVEAAGLTAESPDARPALKWCAGAGCVLSCCAGAPAAPAAAGLADARYLLLKHLCQDEHADAPQQLTVGAVNAQLNALAAAENNKGQVSVLRGLLGRCSAVQGKWLLRIGMSSDRLLGLFHPDALDLYSMTTNLRGVCETLADPNTRVARKASSARRRARARARARAHAPCRAGARGRPGERPAARHAAARAAQVPLSPDDQGIILDGELVVWHKHRGVFEEFGGVRSAMLAARDRVKPDHVIRSSHAGAGAVTADADDLPTAADVELVYVAFDIMFLGDQSVINRSLSDRHKLLARAVRSLPASDPGLPCGGSPIHGRVVTLLPGVPVPLHVAWRADASAAPQGGAFAGAGAAGGELPDMVLSRVGRSQADVQAVYDTALARGDEGIVVKALDAPWRPDDRSGVWVKMKPDYVELSQEIDALIIGVYLGEGGRGGQLSEFLLGLREGGGLGGAGGAEPVRWCSFCKVGTGMSNADRGELRRLLESRLTPAGPGVRPPACYRLCGREKPHFWVSEPLHSVVVEVRADARTIVSRQYAADICLRFPRISKIKWDRNALSVTSYAELEQQVQENKGRLAEAKRDLELGVPVVPRRGKQARGRNAGKAAAARRPPRPLLAPGAELPDVSGVEVVTGLLAGREVAFLSYAPDGLPAAARDAAKRDLGAIVARHGGRQVTTRGAKTAYVFAASLNDAYVEALRRQEDTSPQSAADVLSVEWLCELDAASELPPIMPRHRLYLTHTTRAALAGRAPGGARVAPGEADECGAPFTLEVNADDVAALLGRLMPHRELAAFQAQLAAGEAAQQRALEAAASLEPGATQLPPATQGAAEADGAAAGPVTPKSVLLDVQRELLTGTDWCDRATLFAGCRVFFLELPPPPGEAAGPEPGPGPAHGGAPRGDECACACGDGGPALTPGALEARALAASWRARLAAQQLVDVRLAVMLAGGTVAEAYDPQVTHVVLWPPPQPEQGPEQQQGAAAAAAPRRVWLPGTARACGGEGWVGEDAGGRLQLELTAAQLLRALAGAAEAAAAAAAAAAAEGAARARAAKRGGARGRGATRLRVQPPAAPGGAAPGTQAGGGAGGSLLEAAGASLAVDASGLPTHPGQQEQACPALSPAGLKQLRFIRRRLAAAQEQHGLLADDEPGAHVLSSDGGGTTDGGAPPRPRRRGLPLPPLFLVGPQWVTHSLADLRAVAGGAGDVAEAGWLTQAQPREVVWRGSEALYAPAVALPPPPTADGQPGGQEQPPAAAVAGHDVRGWPWQDVGLAPWGGGGAVGSDTGDAGVGSCGGSSGQQPKRCRRTSSDDASAEAGAPGGGAAGPPKRRAAGKGRGRGRKAARSDGADGDGEDSDRPAPSRRASQRRGAAMRRGGGQADGGHEQAPGWLCSDDEEEERRRRALDAAQTADAAAEVAAAAAAAAGPPVKRQRLPAVPVAAGATAATTAAAVAAAPQAGAGAGGSRGGLSLASLLLSGGTAPRAAGGASQLPATLSSQAGGGRSLAAALLQAPAPLEQPAARPPWAAGASSSGAPAGGSMGRTPLLARLGLLEDRATAPSATPGAVAPAPAVGAAPAGGNGGAGGQPKRSLKALLASHGMASGGAGADGSTGGTA
ncbi:LIG4 [Scenedesmus sp. PABB004]|nr:LIG4 [Scenedesmus sp. PABB004]